MQADEEAQSRLEQSQQELAQVQQLARQQQQDLDNAADVVQARSP